MTYFQMCADIADGESKSEFDRAPSMHAGTTANQSDVNPASPDPSHAES